MSVCVVLAAFPPLSVLAQSIVPTSPQPSLAQIVAPTRQLITLEESTRTLSIGSAAVILEDPASRLTLQQILTPECAAQFQPSAQERLSFGFSSSSYWIALTICNAHPETASQDAWVMEIGYTPLDSIYVFFVDAQGQWQQHLYGDHLPFAARDFNHRTYIVPLVVVDSVPHTYYLRVRSTSSLQIPIEISRAATLYENIATSELGYGALYGMLFVMAAFNVFLFAALRRPHYIWYVAYVFGVLLYYAVLNGHAFQRLWPHSPRFANYMNIFAVGFSITGLAGFARSFLPLARLAPFADRTLQVLMFVGGLIVVAGIGAPYTLMVRVGLLVVSVEVFTALVGGILCWARGNKPARYFVLAVAMFVIGNVLFVLKTSGFVPPTTITNHAVELGSVLEAVLLALALADRYRTLRIEKETAQSAALRMQREANETLEQRVHERTEELEQMNDELQRQMEILDEQANEIEIVNTTLHENNLKLQSLNDEKNEILSIVAHDLKNPLTTVAMNASMVRNYFHKMSAEQSIQLVERIESTAERMHNIILKLLDVNALDTGHVKLTIEDVELAPLLASLVEEYSLRANAKNISLRLEMDDELCRARADKYRLQEIIENLISNAIKFSPRDRTVTISLTSRAEDVRALQERAQQPVMLVGAERLGAERLGIERVGTESEGSTARTDGATVAVCLISVKDEGPGLSDADKQKLFSKFARLSPQPTGGESSTGLGLAIVKKMSVSMNGNVWCESSEGKGAVFTVQIPRAPSLQQERIV
jgi:signal transduction histidine kinase